MTKEEEDTLIHYWNGQSLNSFISWVGGKKALRPLIYERMPIQYKRYVEVFGGGGWVLLGKKKETDMEVYNDYNSNLANLFSCVKERPLAFLKELSFLPLNSREEFFQLRKFLKKEEFLGRYVSEELKLAKKEFLEPEYEEIKAILTENASMDDVKRAAAFYKIIHYSYGSGCTSYGCKPFDIRKIFHLIWHSDMSMVVNSRRYLLQTMIWKKKEGNNRSRLVCLTKKEKDKMNHAVTSK